MNSKCFIPLLLALVVPVCNAGPPDAAEAAATVARLYRDFAWEAVIDEPAAVGKPLVDQPRTVLERYFSKDLAGLILGDRHCRMRTREICKIDFSPLWASQDPGASGLRVAPGATADLVQVSFTYPGDSSKIAITYQLLHSKSGWRIADVLYAGGGSLRALLK